MTDATKDTAPVTEKSIDETILAMHPLRVTEQVTFGPHHEKGSWEEGTQVRFKGISLRRGKFGIQLLRVTEGGTDPAEGMITVSADTLKAKFEFVRS